MRASNQLAYDACHHRSKLWLSYAAAVLVAGMRAIARWQLSGCVLATGTTIMGGPSRTTLRVICGIMLSMARAPAGVDRHMERSADHHDIELLHGITFTKPILRLSHM